MEEVGAASFWPSRGGMAEESLGCLVCLLPTSGVPAPGAERPRLEAVWLCRGSCKGQRRGRQQKGHRENTEVLHFDPSSP